MPNPTWPGGLSQDVLTDGLEETWGNNLLRTPMESGPAKARRRFTAEVKPLALVLEFARADVETFRTFFETTLQGGALPFDWTHPRTGAAITLRFIPPFPVTPNRGAKFWRAALRLEILP